MKKVAGQARSEKLLQRKRGQQVVKQFVRQETKHTAGSRRGRLVSPQISPFTRLYQTPLGRLGGSSIFMDVQACKTALQSDRATN